MNYEFWYCIGTVILTGDGMCGSIGFEHRRGCRFESNLRVNWIIWFIFRPWKGSCGSSFYCIFIQCYRFCSFLFGYFYFYHNLVFFFAPSFYKIICLCLHCDEGVWSFGILGISFSLCVVEELKKNVNFIVCLSHGFNVVDFCVY